jgi:3-oxoacyl-[acyl-carrier-protein] synthase III
MTETSSGFSNFVHAQLRVASLRAKLHVADIDSIIAALSGNFICPEIAIEWADEIGLDIIAASSAAA